MKLFRMVIFLPILILALVACVPPSATDSTLLLTPATPTSNGPTSTPTATIVWFPPEDTATPFPTPVSSPTIDALPGRGEQLASDDFSDPSKWQFAKEEGTGGNDVIIAPNRNRLTIAINVPPAYIFSMRSDLITLKDFYSEVTVNLNRCTAGDTYGMLFRATSNQDAYRYVLGCNGQMRIDRLKANIVVPIQNWLPSGDVPLIAPGKVTIGIWASGVEMRFFLNGHYQFKLVDPVFRFGTLGVFANGNSQNGTNISFSALNVYAVSYASPTPTLTPSKTPTSTRTPRN